MTHPAKTAETHPGSGPIRLRLRRLPGRFFRLLTASAAVLLPLPALAQDDIIDEMKGKLGDVIEIGLILISSAAVIAGAVMVIFTGYQLFREREGLARFGVAILVTIVMIGLTAYLVAEGTTQVEKLTG